MLLSYKIRSKNGCYRINLYIEMRFLISVLWLLRANKKNSVNYFLCIFHGVFFLMFSTMNH